MPPTVLRPASPSRPRPARLGEAGRWGPVVGVVWVAIWLVLLVPTASAAVHLGTARGYAGFAAILVGAAAYSVACLMGFAWGGSLGVRRGAAIAALTAAVAAVAATWALGIDGLDLLAYVAVAVVAAFPLRTSFPLVVVGMAGVTVALYRVDALASTTGTLTGMGVASLGTAMGRFSMERSRAARILAEEVHELELQDERNRMARDLHDILGHSLTVISLKADLAGKLVDRDPEAAKRELGEVQALARAALGDVRATVNNYREVTLSGELARARGALADAGIRAELPGSTDDVDPRLRELFAWAVREATTNVVRHSGAARCRVRLERGVLEVSDDGRGAGGAGGGHGLAGLRDRAQLVGAVVETGPAADGTADRPGFTLVVRDAGAPS